MTCTLSCGKVGQHSLNAHPDEFLRGVARAAESGRKQELAVTLRHLRHLSGTPHGVVELSPGKS